MYNVMLADDDYPVIELLSEAIDWDGLGFRLMGTHENGQSAWEQAQREAPDVLITDIGMPKMDGLELTALIKELKPDVRVAILSCHNEFQYAQQAMRLNVQDYLLKDTLDPENMVELLKKFKQSMDEEKQTGWENNRMKHLIGETRELRKEQSLKNLIHQPLLSRDQWRSEAEEYGLLAEGEACLPVLCIVENYRQVNCRFFSEQTLRFALSNVMNEMLRGMRQRVLYVGYQARISFLLFSYKPDLKTNIYAEASASLHSVRATMESVLKIHMSFLIGESETNPGGLKRRLSELLESEEQLFYLEPGGIAKMQKQEKRSGEQNLFQLYNQASTELKEVLLGKPSDSEAAVVEKWISLIRRERYPSETVKNWVLKLLLDLKLKLHTMQSVSSAYSADTLHKEIVEIGSLSELGDWLLQHLKAMTVSKSTEAAWGKRPEVAEACKYVSLRLNSRITLDEVADHLHLNASYFSRLFKKETGINFIVYVTRQKMELAKELLDGTRLTVGEICEQLGYDNQSYFIKTFKSHVGVTPNEYRG